MKKHISTVILIIAFLAGVCLMMYPTVSDFINKAHQSHEIDTYEHAVSSLTNDDYEMMLQEAYAYNKRLNTNEFPLTQTDLTGNTDYLNALNPSGNGMMGYLKINKIDVRLPIYHTTEEPILQIGVGHMPMTSLPVGGEGTHAILSGHRGLPSAKLFSDLDKLEVGDVFYIYILDDILAYKIDQIKTVEPTDTSDLQIVEGKDYVTLVTCTPYGINTHRLLVRGERVPYESTIADRRNLTDDANIIAPEQIAVFIGAPILFILLITIIIVKKKVWR